MTHNANILTLKQTYDMKILLTGGAGFIGSHTLIELTEAGHEAVVVDNLDNSSPISLKRVAKIIINSHRFFGLTV